MKNFGLTVKLLLFTVIFIIIGIILYFAFPGFRSAITQENRKSVSAEEKITIVIDAGHGGEDGGAVASDGTLEKEINLAVAKDIYSMLKFSGINAILTRENDTMLSDGAINGKKKLSDLRARTSIAQNTANAVLISIHMNKFPDARCKGIQVYYSPNNKKSKSIAEIIQKCAKLYLQPDNKRAIKEATSAIYILKNTTVPAVLVECGFLSNQNDLENLKNKEYQKKLAAVITAAIMNGVTNERS